MFEHALTATRYTKTAIYSRTKLFLTLGAGLQSSACKHLGANAGEGHGKGWLTIHSHLRFAIRAGAKHVIGVDMSTIIYKAREIVAQNGMSDRITLLQGKMEDVQLPFPKVDIIISEWMGYFLLYESMLETVLYARDRYLCPDGLIFPDKATLYIAGIEDGDYKEEKIGCKLRRSPFPRAVDSLTYWPLVWDNVWGFDFTPLKRTALCEPLVDVVEMKAVVTDPTHVLTIDLYNVSADQLAFNAPFTLAVRRNDFIHALIAWFDIEFSACHKPIRFSTGPHAKYTHWKQTVFYLSEALTVEEGERVNGKMCSRPNDKNKRDLDISIAWNLESADSGRSTLGEMSYKMSVNSTSKTFALERRRVKCSSYPRLSSSIRANKACQIVCRKFPISSSLYSSSSQVRDSHQLTPPNTGAEVSLS